jgi:hypothetical protein
VAFLFVFFVLPVLCGLCPMPCLPPSYVVDEHCFGPGTRVESDASAMLLCIEIEKSNDPITITITI